MDEMLGIRAQQGSVAALRDRSEHASDNADRHFHRAVSPRTPEVRGVDQQ